MLFGKECPEKYPEDVQCIRVYCDDYHNVFAALSKAYAQCINVLSEYENIGCSCDINTNKSIGNGRYVRLLGAGRKYGNDINFQYTKSRLKLLEDMLWCIDHSEELITLVKGSSNKEAAQNTIKEKYAFDDYQVRKIFELRFDLLTKAEVEDINKELRDGRTKERVNISLLLICAKK